MTISLLIFLLCSIGVFWIVIGVIILCIRAIYSIASQIFTWNTPTSQQAFSISTSSKNLLAIEQACCDDVLQRVNTSSDSREHIWVEYIDEDLIVQSSDATVNVKSHSVVFRPKTLPANNETILLVHGANSGPLYWFEVASLIAQQGKQVHCIALPGFGETMVLELDLLSLSPSALKEFFIEYLRAYILLHFHANTSTFEDLSANHINTPVIAGHSFGGFLVSALICKHHNLCKSAILVNAAGIFPIFGRETMRWGALFKSGFPHYYMRQLGYLNNGLIFSYFSNFEAGVSPASYWNVALMNCKDNFGETLVSRFVHYNGWNCHWKCCTLPKLLTTTGLCPLAMIWGADDTIIPVHSAEMLCKFSYKDSQIRLCSISGSWHSPLLSSRVFATTLDVAIRNVQRLRALPTPQDMKSIERIVRISAKASCSFPDTQRVIDRMYMSLNELLTEDMWAGAIVLDEIEGIDSSAGINVD